LLRSSIAIARTVNKDEVLCTQSTCHDTPGKTRPLYYGFLISPNMGEQIKKVPTVWQPPPTRGRRKSHTVTRHKLN